MEFIQKHSTIITISVSVVIAVCVLFYLNNKINRLGEEVRCGGVVARGRTYPMASMAAPQPTTSREMNRPMMPPQQQPPLIDPNAGISQQHEQIYIAVSEPSAQDQGQSYIVDQNLDNDELDTLIDSELEQMRDDKIESV